MEVKRIVAWLFLVLVFSSVLTLCFSFISTSDIEYSDIETNTVTPITNSDVIPINSINQTTTLPPLTITTTTVATTITPITTTTTTTTTTTVRIIYPQRGMSGDEVTAIQKRLIELGYMKTSATGYFGSNTYEAVKAFQRQTSLTVDGIVGPKTKDKLFSSSAPRATTTTVATNSTVTQETSSNGLVSLGTFTLTAYCPCSNCCGQWSNGITSTGVTAQAGHTIAVDPKVIPYGTVVVINGHEYVAEDCGGAIKGNKIDIYFNTHQEALNFGRRKAEVFIKK